MTAQKRILLVEDDRRLGKLIGSYLAKQGFGVSIERRGDAAPNRILWEAPDLVILDLLLPGLDGLTICQQVRSDYQGPILMLTALEDDMDQVAGLEMGADDYVKKPVEPRVLLARIRALLRRFDKITPVGCLMPMDAKRTGLRQPDDQPLIPQRCVGRSAGGGDHQRIQPALAAGQQCRPDYGSGYDLPRIAGH